MKAGPQLALAIGAGYLLGRKRRLRWALVLAAAGATGRMGGVTGTLLSQAKAIASRSELGEIGSTVRGPLLEASKAAVLAAVGGRLESLTDSLQERAGTLGVPSSSKAEAKDGRGRKRKRRERDEREEPEDAEEPEDEELEDEEDVEPEDEDYADEADEPDEADEADETEDEPAPRRARRRASASGSSRSPVRRSGRR